MFFVTILYMYTNCYPFGKLFESLSWFLKVGGLLLLSRTRQTEKSYCTLYMKIISDNHQFKVSDEVSLARLLALVI
jgi:hypothetical protein